MGVGGIRLQLHRSLEAGSFIIEPAESQVDVAEVVLRGGELRIEGDRVGNGGMRIIEPAGLQRDDAKQMHGVDMLRARRQ